MVGIKLESLFRAPAQIAVLRALWKAPTELTGRQVQHLAGVHNRTALTCLADLEGLGILRRRAAGRAYLYALKREHRLVRDLIDPLFTAERALPEQLVQALGTLINGYCLSAVLYGSVARNHSQPGSDVDLLVVVADEAAAVKFAATVQENAERRVRERWGAVLEVNVKTQRQLGKEWNSGVIKGIRREGRVIAGRPLAEVKRGRTS